MYSVGIITASDKGSAGERIDKSGETIREIVENAGYEVKKYIMLPDEKEKLKKEMKHMADDLEINLVLTTGGTGFSVRDITPEATKEVIERETPGISEAIRQYSMGVTKRAMLSRAVSGIRGKTLIINLPGSPKAVRESLEYIITELEHGLKILNGHEGECAR
ncbi:MAG: MogA/MoaB family molybdenum cofactor biosynthesis protein [Clostridiaceae bacterium]